MPRLTAPREGSSCQGRTERPMAQFVASSQDGLVRRNQITREGDPMIRRLIALAFGFLILAGPASAKPQVTGTIEGPFGDARFDGHVTFNTTFNGRLHGQESLRIVVSCYQGNELVYAEALEPGWPFHLGGTFSPWRDAGGGEATCEATLSVYAVYSANKVTNELLDSTGPWTAGA